MLERRRRTRGKEFSRRSAGNCGNDRRHAQQGSSTRSDPDTDRRVGEDKSIEPTPLLSVSGEPGRVVPEFDDAKERIATAVGAREVEADQHIPPLRQRIHHAPLETSGIDIVRSLEGPAVHKVDILRIPDPPVSPVRIEQTKLDVRLLGSVAPSEAIDGRDGADDLRFGQGA